MLTYNNDPSIKQKYINRMQARMDAGELIRGVEFENGRGCAVGCTLGNYNHSEFEKEIAPEWVAHLIDIFHEGTSAQVWPTFAITFLKTLPVGKDLAPLESKMKIFILNQSKDVVLKLDHLDSQVKEKVLSSIEQCITFHETEFSSDESAARSAAESAARSAVWSAEAAARYAAAAATEAATEAAESAARSAVWSAEAAAEADESAESAIYDEQAKYFLKLLSEI